MPIKSLRTLYQPRPCFDAAAGGGGPVTTAQLITLLGANIVGIWDADLGVLKTGSNVTSWTDQSSNGYVLGLNPLTTSGTPTSPVFSSSSYGGKAGITSSIISQFLCTTVGAVSFGTNTSSFFAAATLAAASETNGRLLTFDNNIGADWNQLNNISAINRDGTNQAITGTQNTVGVTPYSITYDAPSRLGLVCDNTNMTPYFNNAVQPATAQSFTLAATGRIAVFEGNSAGSTWFGVIRRVLVLKSVASSGDRSSIDSWLQG